MNPLIFSALCALAVLALLYAEWKDRGGLKRLFKPLASLAFILTGVSAGALESPFGLAILAGLIFCAAGDLLLIPRGEKSFLAGMAAFAAGHGAYIAAFVIGGVALTTQAAIAGIAAAVFSGGLLLWLWRDLGSFRAPVIAYAAIISAMVAASVAHWAAGPTPGTAQLMAAAAGFAVSDLSVARDQFKRRAFINRLWGLPLYYAAQCMFAFNV